MLRETGNDTGEPVRFRTLLSGFGQCLVAAHPEWLPKLMKTLGFQDRRLW